MKHTHLKVQFVGSFTGVPVNESSTVQDVVDYLLDKNEVSLKYSSLCTLLYIGKDMVSYPLLHNETMPDVFSKLPTDTPNEVHFRILAIPIDEEISNLEPTFVELLYNQVQRLIITRTWASDDDVAIKLAGYRAGVEFGKFDSNKHKPGMLAKVLHTYLPQDFIANNAKKTNKLEQHILDAWSQATKEGECNSREETMQTYLKYMRKSVPQYGCATFICKTKSVNGKNEQSFVYFCVRKTGFLLLSANGEKLGSGDFQQTVLQHQPNGLMKVQMLNTYELEVQGYQSLNTVIEFIKNAKIE